MHAHTLTHNIWLWPKRPPLAFSVAETSVAEMSRPKRPRPKCLWPKCPTFVYQTPTFPPHFGNNIKVKSQNNCQANPALLKGLGEAVVTNEWCIRGMILSSDPGVISP